MSTAPTFLNAGNATTYFPFPAPTPNAPTPAAPTPAAPTPAAPTPAPGGGFDGEVLPDVEPFGPDSRIEYAPCLVNTGQGTLDDPEFSVMGTDVGAGDEVYRRSQLVQTSTVKDGQTVWKLAPPGGCPAGESDTLSDDLADLLGGDGEGGSDGAGSSVVPGMSAGRLLALTLGGLGLLVLVARSASKRRTRRR